MRKKCHKVDSFHTAGRIDMTNTYYWSDILTLPHLLGVSWILCFLVIFSSCLTQEFLEWTIFYTCRTQPSPREDDVRASRMFIARQAIVHIRSHTHTHSHLLKIDRSKFASCVLWQKLENAHKHGQNKTYTENHQALESNRQPSCC